MSVCNRMTLAQFGRLATPEDDALPVDQIAFLLETIAVKEHRIGVLKAKLAELLTRRYGSAARELFELGRETTNTVTLLDGSFIVKAELPQRVTWDQKKLAKLAEIIFHDWQRDPEDYITISYAVDERTYVGWPAELRKHFEDARAVGTGATEFCITAIKEARPKKAAGDARAG